MPAEAVQESEYPPPGTVPALVPLGLVVATGSHFDLRFEAGRVYRTGVMVEAAVRARSLGLYEQQQMADQIFGFRTSAGDDSPIITAKVVGPGEAAGGETMCGGTVGVASAAQGESLTLRPWDTSGGGDLWRFSCWLSPLPRTGSVALDVTWRSRGIRAVRQVIDGEALRVAAAQAVELWPEPPVGEHSYRSTV